jgi:hypothetical protein
MIWGYGFGSGRDERGVQAGYGPFRTARILDKNPKFNTILEEVSSDLRGKMLSASNPRDFDEAIETAYDKVAYDPRVKWWGPAFFTKYLYFLGRAIDRHNCPLILDKKVVESLGNVSQRFARVEGQGLRPWTEGYMRYLWNMREWTGQVGCLADDIECFLYEQSAKKQSRTCRGKRE